MKLFGDFQAVYFPQEEMILVTDGDFLVYFYRRETGLWQKYENGRNLPLSVSRYPDVTRGELRYAMKGSFPRKETDFLRLCPPSDLCIADMLALLREDFPAYLSDREIVFPIHEFLLKAEPCYKGYLRLRDLLREARERFLKKEEVLTRLRELSLSFLGRELFPDEIGIVDGHDSSSYFWIMPARVIDYADPEDTDNVAELRALEISIEENDVDFYLAPFFFDHFEEALEANRRRKYASGFEWNLTYNYYTLAAVRAMLADIRETRRALLEGRETAYTREVLPEADPRERDRIADFYRRFLCRMDYMLQVAKEKGYPLISVMGP